MGTSADGLGRACNTAVQFPLVNSLVANSQLLGFRAPENTPVDCPSFTMPSQRLASCGSVKHVYVIMHNFLVQWGFNYGAGLFNMKLMKFVISA